eukprot:jgi/Hompol1/3220/HPOL_006407-RA
MVLTLQDKIRHTGSLIRSLSRPQTAAKRSEMQQLWKQGRDELHILMEALKGLQQIERRRKSENIAYQLYLAINKLEWKMLLDSGEPFLRWTLTNPYIAWTHREDQSTVYILEIDTLQVDNLQTQALFPNVVSPYIPSLHPIDFKRNKMLRVYSREMPPVAGIQVVDHFEINMFPLSIQLTYEVGKQLMRYVFPDKKGGSNAGAAAAAAAAAATGSSSGVALYSTSSTQAAVPDSNLSISPSPSRPVTPIDESTTRQHRRYPNLLHSTDSSESSFISRRGRSGTDESAPSPSGKLQRLGAQAQMTELKQMQTRASESHSFIYIKVPSVLHSLTYRGPKEKNFEDLHMFEFYLPTLEYRNKTWTWYDFVSAIKKDAMRAALANTGALVREKLFQKRKMASAHQNETGNTNTLSSAVASIDDSDMAFEQQQVKLGQQPPMGEQAKSKKQRGGILKNILKRSDRRDEHDDTGGLASAGAASASASGSGSASASAFSG